MATSKPTRTRGCETDRFFQELFRGVAQADDREYQWKKAVAHTGEGSYPMRFPIYECLFLINVHSQKLIDLLEEAKTKYGVTLEQSVHFKSLVQYVRAGASQEIVSLMNDIEVTEEWLFERLRAEEERKLCE